MIKRMFPWIFIAGTVGVLVGLGAWQMQRLTWKQELMAQYEKGRELSPLTLSDISNQTLNSHSYRRVTATGTFHHDKEVHLGGRRWHGKTGYQILTPLELNDGRFFLVNRGWIPFEMKEQTERPTPLPEGEVTVSGVIRFPKAPNFITPSNHPEKNFWFSVDYPAIEGFTNLSLAPAVIEVTADEPDINRFPIVSDGIRVFRNDHLGYAITWFSLAIAALIFFWARVLRKQPEEKA